MERGMTSPASTTGLDALGGTVALVFPGQGSQFVGMGRTLYEGSAAARRVFDHADEVLGFKLSRLCFDGPAESLEDTINAQPAILTASVAALEALRERAQGAGAKLQPVMVAGHSLGEFTALVAAGVIDFPSALRVVRERGRLMKEAGEAQPGGMAAVIGLDRETMAGVVAQAEADGVVALANDNCPGQSVISGELGALQRAMDLAKQAGAKRVARLGISIASHSPLMARASQQLREKLDGLPLQPPRMPVIANATGAAMHTVDEIRQELAHHVERPVNWTRSVREMVDAGVSTFVEVGPGQVLSGLIRRIERDATVLGPADLGLPIDQPAKS
jgi:[acyl-carrier-protein] S-malonyltransferase